MANATLTVANSVIMLMITDLFPVPQQLQGYAADNVMTTQPVKSMEAVMGVDGKMSFGWMPTAKIWRITLQADSASTFMFDAWQQAQEAAQDGYIADGFITLPAIGRLYTLTRGGLTDYSPMPDAQKMLQPRHFEITWQSIIGAPI